MIDNPERRFREAWSGEIPERIVDCTMRFVWIALAAGAFAAVFFMILFVRDARLLH